MPDPDRHPSVAQLRGSPKRRFYTGRDLSRAIAVEDLRAMTHKRLPRFALEYLEGGAEEEASLARDREAYASWRFTPRQLVDVAQRSLATEILGRPAAMPLVIAPTGLNGLFRHRADSALAQAAAQFGIPFAQSTMSNDAMEEVGAAPGLRHWWQLYVFGPDAIWQALLERADAAGCEALVLTTNAQIFGDRDWDRRTRVGGTRPSLPTVFNAALHPRWLFSTILAHGMPRFRNVESFVPKDHHGFFQTAHWIRSQQSASLTWETVERIRRFWRKPMLVKGILHLDDVRRALDSGIDGIVLSTHGGRQLDWTVAPLDLLPAARQIVGDRMALFTSGGVRRGTDLLKALALGADGVLAGRAPLYGVAAGGAPGVLRALEIIRDEAQRAMGLLGVRSVHELGPQFLARFGELPELCRPG